MSEDTPPHITAPRLLFYTVNGLGLGHVTRQLAIARAVRRARPLTQFLFLTTSEADNVIYREGFPSVKLPSKSAIVRTGLRPRVFNKLTHSVVLSTVSAFNPAVMVVDSFPAGASQELLPTLSWEMRRAFVFRAQQAERAYDPFLQSALSAYDLCIIPHRDGTEEIPVPESVKQIWTGEIFIRSREDALTRDEAREVLGLPQDARVLYVSFGGGGEDELQNALAITLEAARGLGWTLVVADAPLAATRAFEKSCDVDFVRIRHYPMAEYFNAFDAAVSAAGYNTAAELMHFGVPAILIPFARGLDDQFARVKKLESEGAALAGTLDTEQLRKQLIELMHTGVASRLSSKAKERVPNNGAAAAAEAILDLL